jgi:hypothetical protein
MHSFRHHSHEEDTMGKASRLKRERTQVTVTHEPLELRNWPDGHVGVALTGEEQGESPLRTMEQDPALTALAHVRGVKTPLIAG